MRSRSDDRDGLCDRDNGYPYPNPPPPSPCYDIYQRDLTSKTTSLVSTGPAGGDGSFDADFAGMTDDAAHVYFETREKLVPEDDGRRVHATTPASPIPCIDVYERVGGTTRLVSQGPGDTGRYDAQFARRLGRRLAGVLLHPRAAQPG